MEGGISSDSELAQSVLEVPAINWANCLGVKSLQYIKIGQDPRIQELEPNNWDHENTVRDRKGICNRSSAINDGNNQRPGIIKNPSLPGVKTIRQHPRRIEPVETEIIHKVRTSILRKETHRPFKPTDHRYHAPTQGSPRHKRDGETFLVAETIRSDTRK